MDNNDPRRADEIPGDQEQIDSLAASEPQTAQAAEQSGQPAADTSALPGIPESQGSPTAADAVLPFLPQGEPGQVQPTVVNGDLHPNKPAPSQGPVPLMTGSLPGLEKPLDVAPSEPTAHDRVWAREAKQRNERRARLGKEPFELPNLGEGGEFGDKSPGFDLARTASDMAGSFTTHQQQLIRVISTMQQVLIESIARLEAIEAYFDRLR